MGEDKVVQPKENQNLCSYVKIWLTGAILMVNRIILFIVILFTGYIFSRLTGDRKQKSLVPTPPWIFCFCLRTSIGSDDEGFLNPAYYLHLFVKNLAPTIVPLPFHSSGCQSGLYEYLYTFGWSFGIKTIIIHIFVLALLVTNNSLSGVSSNCVTLVN